MPTYGDPKVREWMKVHEEEVKRVNFLYSGLSRIHLTDLIPLARSLGVDTESHKQRLITDIVKTAPDKAREVLLGQGFLPLDERRPNKKG